MTKSVIVVGLGEIGKPLFNILNRSYPCVGVDIEAVEVRDSCSVLHICYPFQLPDYVGTTVAYIRKYKPELTIINGTVVPGTTKRVADASGARVAYSPVRGKHLKMEQDLLKYHKFVAADDSAVAELAAKHFQGAGFKTGTFRSSQIGELAKLMETTWFGVLIGFAQDVERIGERYGATYEDLRAYIREVDFLPHHIFPGLIGGHCVMPNIALLKTQIESDFLDAVQKSNELKRAEMEQEEVQVGQR